MKYTVHVYRPAEVFIAYDIESETASGAVMEAFGMVDAEILKPQRSDMKLIALTWDENGILQEKSGVKS